MSANGVPLDYLLSSSDPALESIQLSCLGRAAALRKEMQDVMEEWIQAQVDAQLARWLLANRGGDNQAHKTAALAPTSALVDSARQPTVDTHCAALRPSESKQLAIGFDSRREQTSAFEREKQTASKNIQPKVAVLKATTVTLKSSPTTSARKRSEAVRLKSTANGANDNFVGVCRTLAFALAAGIDNSADAATSRHSEDQTVYHSASATRLNCGPQNRVLLRMSA
jgi:hypothetical protein